MIVLLSTACLYNFYQDTAAASITPLGCAACGPNAVNGVIGSTDVADCGKHAAAERLVSAATSQVVINASVCKPHTALHLDARQLGSLLAAGAGLALIAAKKCWQSIVNAVPLRCRLPSQFRWLAPDSRWLQAVRSGFPAGLPHCYRCFGYRRHPTFS